MALMAFGDEHVWLRHGMALACLLVFMLLDIDPGVSPATYRLPDEVRSHSLWMHPLTALLNLYFLLYLMQTDAMGRSRLERELGMAVVDKQFELYYQPQVNVQGRVVGAEALLRWMHPQRGLIGPGEFIRLAEKTGLIVSLGRWVLEVACKQLQVWSGYSMTRHLSLAVNISEVQFAQADFVEQVLALIAHYKIDASRLELEFTESMLVDDIEDRIDKMSTLRAHGVRFSMDDFGTGFSSLNKLKLLPLNKLKIDQSFVRDLLTDPYDVAIVRTVLALGQSLDLTVLVKGVETKGQRQCLVDYGCHLFQGYLYGHPIPAADFNAFLIAHEPV